MIIRSAPINGGLPNGLVRGGVVLKSTTLNERNPLLVANKPVNTRPSPSKSVLTHPAPLPPASVGPSNPLWKAAPKPSLDIKRVANGIQNFRFSFVILKYYWLQASFCRGTCKGICLCTPTLHRFSCLLIRKDRIRRRSTEAFGREWVTS